MLAHRVVVGEEPGGIEMRYLVQASSGRVLAANAAGHPMRERQTSTVEIDLIWNGIGFDVAYVPILKKDEVGDVAPYVGDLADVEAAHEHAGEVYDYYADRFARDSYDDQGAVILSWVDSPGEVTNWDQDNRIIHYQNEAFAFSYHTSPAHSPEIVGHEFHHAVQLHEYGEAIGVEGGAAFEALADAFGKFGEFHADGMGNWLLGDEVSTHTVGAIRNMEDPTFGTSWPYSVPGSQPDHYDELNLDAYLLGVHHNAGIVNKAIYLLSEGGVVGATSLDGIGVENVEHVLYEATVGGHIAVLDRFIDLRNSMVSACLLAPLTVPTPQCQDQVRLAFQAVGVVDQLRIKASLQGAIDASDPDRMRFVSDLSTPYPLPATDPYAGNVTLPAQDLGMSLMWDLVDWVEVAVVNPTTDVVLEERVGFLRSDGLVVEVDGHAPLQLTATGRIRLSHRNHLSVTTAASYSPNADVVLDLTDPSTALVTGPLADSRRLSGGRLHLAAGDADGSGSINAGDRSIAWNDGGLTGYLDTDLNLDGLVDMADVTLAWNNRNLSE
jgi:hypothetical protein